MSFEQGVLVLFGVFAVIAVTGVAVVVAIIKALFRAVVRGAVRETDRALSHHSMAYRRRKAMARAEYLEPVRRTFTGQ